MTLRLHLVGGLGVFGRNSAVVQDLDTGDALVLDAGVGFTNEPGCRELSIHDPAFLEAYRGKLKGYVITHGHEDHIGALGYFHRQLPAPVYGGPTSLALIQARCQDVGLPVPELRPLLPGQETQVGSFRVTALSVAHSIPDSLAVVVEGAGVRLLHSGDFRVDDSPVTGQPTDMAGLAFMGELGVDLLMVDSTGALSPGTNPGERSIRTQLTRLFAEASGRVFLTTFASHIQRLALVAEVSAAAGRKVVLAGRGMLLHARIARELGNAPWSEGLMLHPSAALDASPRALTVIVSGCQGEERSAFWRLAAEDPGLPPVKPGDKVIHSARAIPGSEVAIAFLLDALACQGAEVHDAADGVHVSGHGYRDDLSRLVETVRPRAVLPVHGGHRHLRAMAGLARDRGVPPDMVPLLREGDLLEVAPHAAPWPCGRRSVRTMLVDDCGRLSSQQELTEERRELQGGVVLIAANLHARSGEITRTAVSTRGLAGGAADLVEQAGRAEAHAAVAELTAEERASPECVEAAMVRGVRRLLRRLPIRSPAVLARVMAVD